MDVRTLPPSNIRDMPENVVKTNVAARELGIGPTRMAAAKRRLGVKGRWVLVSVFRKFFAEHPDFSERDVYHPANCTCPKCGDKRADGWKPKDCSKRKPPTKRAEAVAAH